MKMKMDNKGFSLVELIIVIAIMAILISALAPQYVKFATNARVIGDMSNAKEIAKAFEAAIAEINATDVPEDLTGPGGTSVVNVPGITELPMCKVNPTYEWKITCSNATGIVEIKLNNFVIYPDAYATGGYYEEYHID